MDATTTRPSKNVSSAFFKNLTKYQATALRGQEGYFSQKQAQNQANLESAHNFQSIFPLAVQTQELIAETRDDQLALKSI